MDQPQTPRQVKYLERLAEAKGHLLKAIADIDPAILCTEPVVGDWTVKDILGHIVSWNEEFRADIKLIQQGYHPGFECVISGEDDFDHWNQIWIKEKRDWTWQRILADMEQDYQEAVQMILQLEPQDYRKRGVTPWKRAAIDRPAQPTTADTESIETLVTYHWRHMNQHARMIERWRKHPKIPHP